MICIIKIPAWIFISHSVYYVRVRQAYADCLNFIGPQLYRREGWTGEESEESLK
jgi:hypothetical protein